MKNNFRLSDYSTTSNERPQVAVRVQGLMETLLDYKTKD